MHFQNSIKYTLVFIFLMVVLLLPLLTFAHSGDGHSSCPDWSHSPAENRSPCSVAPAGSGNSVNRLGITYQTMVDIPGVDDATTGSVTVASYLNILYNIAIVAAALLAVVKIVFAGAKYMLAETSVSSKQQSINDISSGIVGLLIIICAVLILGTINPDLGSIKFISPGDFSPTNIQGTGGTTAGTTVSPTYTNSTLNEQVISNYSELSDTQKQQAEAICTAEGGSLVIKNGGTAICRGVLTIIPELNTLANYYAVNNEFIDQSLWSPELREAQESNYIHNVANQEPEAVTVGLADESVVWESIQAVAPELNSSEHQIAFIVENTGLASAEYTSIQTQQEHLCGGERFNGTLETVTIPGETNVSLVCVTYK